MEQYMWSIDFFDDITANFFLTREISDDLINFLACNITTFK